MGKQNTSYFIENGKLYCEDDVFEPYEVECTVEVFLRCLEEEGY